MGRRRSWAAGRDEKKPPFAPGVVCHTQAAQELSCSSMPPASCAYPGDGQSTLVVPTDRNTTSDDQLSSGQFQRCADILVANAAAAAM